ncbi:MAG: type IV toxin-antitoxin system AbiEi family antitoxin domain-containing protein [Nocardioides sp.]
MELIADLLQTQCGVVSRRQVLSRGLDDAFLARAVRRRALRRVHPGVYVSHTGPLTWWQRAWAAVLFYEPAALTHESVLVAEGFDRPPDAAEGPVHIVIDHARRVASRPGVVLHRRRGLVTALHPSRTPPRMRLEEAVLDVASMARSDADAVAMLADACASRRTTAARLARVLVQRVRLPRRCFLAELLLDVAQGTYSVLEHRYLSRVERPHGLPTATRQRRVHVGRSRAYRDVEYLPFDTVVELDGRLGHDGAQDRWDDLDRDLAGIVGGTVTVRLGWRQVLSPCRVATAVAAVLTARGWTGELRPCSTTCTAIQPVQPAQPAQPARAARAVRAVRAVRGGSHSPAA